MELDAPTLWLQTAHSHFSPVDGAFPVLKAKGLHLRALAKRRGSHLLGTLSLPAWLLTESLLAQLPLPCWEVLTVLTHSAPKLAGNGTEYTLWWEKRLVSEEVEETFNSESNQPAVLVWLSGRGLTSLLSGSRIRFYLSSTITEHL